jgi:hypothetical protein
MRELAAEMLLTAETLSESADLLPVGQRLAEGVAALERATDWILTHRGPDAMTGATPYLKLAGDVIGGWVLGKHALLAAGADAPWLRAKAPLARLYAEQVLAQAPGLAAGVMQGGADLEATPAEALSG